MWVNPLKGLSIIVVNVRGRDYSPRCDTLINTRHAHSPRLMPVLCLCVKPQKHQLRARDVHPVGVSATHFFEKRLCFLEKCSKGFCPTFP